MKKQITHLSVHQTSKVIAAMYAAILTVLVVLPIVIHLIFLGDYLPAILGLIFSPLIYWLILYIGHVIGCWFYNIVAKRFGGIEFEMVNVDKVDDACCKHSNKTDYPQFPQ